MTHHNLRRPLGFACATLAVLTLSAPVAGVGGPGTPTDRRATTKTANAKTTTVTRGAPTSIGSHTTTIMGSAWNADNSPIKFANLRLRDVEDGRIEALTKANDAGQFSFENVPAGSYLVELVNDAGKIEAVGNMFGIAPGESVTTFVRLGTKVPWVVTFFNNAAGAITATAASGGITALAAPRLCSSPPCH